MASDGRQVFDTGSVGDGETRTRRTSATKLRSSPGTSWTPFPEHHAGHDLRLDRSRWRATTASPPTSDKDSDFVFDLPGGLDERIQIAVTDGDQTKRIYMGVVPSSLDAEPVGSCSQREHHHLRQWLHRKFHASWSATSPSTTSRWWCPTPAPKAAGAARHVRSHQFRRVLGHG